MKFNNSIQLSNLYLELRSDLVKYNMYLVGMEYKKSCLEHPRINYMCLVDIIKPQHFLNNNCLAHTYFDQEH